MCEYPQFVCIMKIIKSKKTILVVEDEVALQEAISIRLTAAGYFVVSAMSAEWAIELLKTVKPDLVWLDLLLPGMGGLIFLERIRKNELLKNIPVMIVSVSGGPEKMKEAFQLNVVYFVVKSNHRLEDIIKKVDVYTAMKNTA